MELEYQKVLVTGAAGFIGFHLARRLLKDGYQVVGAGGVLQREPQFIGA